MKSIKGLIPGKFIIFSASILIAIFIVENINHRFWLNDFKVYYGAVQAFIDRTPVYNTLYSLGSGFYKYSPFTILLVLPVCLLPYKIAAIIQYCLLSVSIISVFLVCGYIINKYLFPGRIKKQSLLLSIAFICVINHLVRELHLGNINVILLLLLCLSLLFNLQSKYILSGILLAIVIITKPFFALLLLPLLLRTNYKTVFSFSISILLFVLAPALLIGLTANIRLHAEWVQTLLSHNSSFPSNNTIESLVKIYINSDIPSIFQFFIMIAACIGYLIFFFNNRSEEKKEPRNVDLKYRNFIIEWFALIAMMPSLFRTDTQHFLLALPFIMILMVYVSLSKKYLLIIFFINLVLMYGGNSSDMIGKNMSVRFNDAGILGMSNLVIIFSVIFIYIKSLRKKNEFEIKDEKVELR